MKVLVIGSGAREHAFVKILNKSNRVKSIFSYPCNAATIDISVPSYIKSNSDLIKWAKDNLIDWVVIGSEVPLSEGLADDFRDSGINCFGVGKDAAILESSKAFSKNLMLKYKIPTANYKVFSNYDTALNYINNSNFPIVIKADGLAAGKGVFICKSKDEAISSLKDIIIKRRFNSAGDSVVIENYLDGQEMSAFAFCDGDDIVPLIYARDYKKRFEGDKGDNTGGMGSYAPITNISKSLQDKINNTVLKATLNALKKEGILYQGILYAGLMIQGDDIKVLEFNVRFGDPEAQVILPLMKNDIIDIFEAIYSKNLKSISLSWENKFAVCVVMASKEYPKNSKIGFEIKGLNEISENDNLYICHAATKKENNKIVTSGGRVLNVISISDDLKSAKQKAYDTVSSIDFENLDFRNDINREFFSVNDKKLSRAETVKYIKDNPDCGYHIRKIHGKQTPVYNPGNSKKTTITISESHSERNTHFLVNGKKLSRAKTVKYIKDNPDCGYHILEINGVKTLVSNRDNSKKTTNDIAKNKKAKIKVIKESYSRHN